MPWDRNHSSIAIIRVKVKVMVNLQLDKGRTIGCDQKRGYDPNNLNDWSCIDSCVKLSCT